MSEPSEPVVSIQRADTHDAVVGHLAWGVLVGPDLVVVPGPVDWLRDEKMPVEVLLAPKPTTGTAPGFIERIKVESATTLGLSTEPAGAVAFLQLAQESRFRPVGEEYQRQQLLAPLHENPDVWRAFESVGAVPAGVRELPAAELLSPVRDWETDHRRGLVNDESGRTVAEVVARICPISPKCH
ncbi:hypothetical protein [Streptomyces olivaceiscleroticus]|uniref:Uncharacterized protein n=1 Tax=Streptomyces olivaceiscleroticus TaxID=68245 RepID=A0ABN0ZZD9_9ACTN